MVLLISTELMLYLKQDGALLMLNAALLRSESVLLGFGALLLNDDAPYSWVCAPFGGMELFRCSVIE